MRRISTDAMAKALIDWDDSVVDRTPLLVIDGREISWDKSGRRTAQIAGTHHQGDDIGLTIRDIHQRGLRPAATGRRNAGRRLRRQPLGQQHRTSVQALVAQVDGFKFVGSPAHGWCRQIGKVRSLRNDVRVVCNGMHMTVELG